MLLLLCRFFSRRKPFQQPYISIGFQSYALSAEQRFSSALLLRFGGHTGGLWTPTTPKRHCALYQASQLARPALGRHDVRIVYQIANDDLLHSKAPSRQPSPRPSPRRSPNLNPLHGSDVTGLNIGTPASILASQLSVPEDLSVHMNFNMASQEKSKTPNQDRLKVPTQGDGESGGPQFMFNTGADPGLKVRRLGGNKFSDSERITNPTQSTPRIPNQANLGPIDNMTPEELYNRFFGPDRRSEFKVGEQPQHMKTE